MKYNLFGLAWLMFTADAIISHTAALISVILTIIGIIWLIISTIKEFPPVGAVERQVRQNDKETFQKDNGN